MFLKSFEIRWSDLDANRHLANSAYINFMSHTRMAYLNTVGINQKSLAKYNIGPVVFFEHMYYFKEVFAGKPIQVSLGLRGLSETGMFFEFEHDFYDSDGKNFARCEMMGAWMDLRERKLTHLPEEVMEAFEKAKKTLDFRIITKEDTRRNSRLPKDLVSS